VQKIYKYLCSPKRNYTQLIKALVLACGTYRRKIVALGRQCSEASFETWETGAIMVFEPAYPTGNKLPTRGKPVFDLTQSNSHPKLGPPLLEPFLALSTFREEISEDGDSEVLDLP